MRKIKIAVLGAGAFGTALAILFSKFFDVSLFSGFEDHALSMKVTRKNSFLEGFYLPENISIDVIHNLKNYGFEDYILWCFPTSPSVSLLNSIKHLINKDSVILICAKGISDSGKFLYDEFSDVLPNSRIGIFAGPNLAYEIASFKFSTSDVGFGNIAIAKQVSEDLSNIHLKLIPGSDVVGIQIAGIIKNVIAIACGILRGLEAGENAQATLITYGLYEMSVLGEVLFANIKTFYGVSGVGDLILTTTSEHSRNLNFGVMLARGLGNNNRGLDTPVCEGESCIANLMKICHNNDSKIDLPICRAVFDIIRGNKQPSYILDVLERK
jgi:glycerol-3-phosphate dehydrogenase (NAD(P)+)